MADQTDRRARYKAAIRDNDGWVLDDGQHLLDAVMAIADAELAEARDRYKAGLRRADKVNNELMEEVQRYAEGTERPVLWSVYNRMHLRAAAAENVIERIGALADRWENALAPDRAYAESLRAALDGAEPPAAPTVDEAEQHRRALSLVLSLGTSAPWDAIHQRVHELEVKAIGTHTEAASAVDAHPPTHTWKVESPRREKWASWGATYDDREWAQERYESAIEHGQGRPFRLVRATTTYTVEAKHTPAAEGA
ncbi:MAG: hypothetical protein HOY79_04280 [Streptomyces sp.]|nr:hypothetical protein [Streptomyces sp.]NUS15423.1 hypothetical protein [Streptomyces sp.]NUS24119.1 hypothetical protein [Streptomyces sp.]